MSELIKHLMESERLLKEVVATMDALTEHEVLAILGRMRFLIRDTVPAMLSSGVSYISRNMTEKFHKQLEAINRGECRVHRVREPGPIMVDIEINPEEVLNNLKKKEELLRALPSSTQDGWTFGGLEKALPIQPVTPTPELKKATDEFLRGEGVSAPLGTYNQKAWDLPLGSQAWMRPTQEQIDAVKVNVRKLLEPFEECDVPTIIGD